MYFIAFILQIKENRVVPYKWTRGINYEATMNNGLNKNIKFRVFWTNDPNAFDEHGVPKIDYIPNPNACGTVFPAEGWYVCQVKKFKVERAEAVAYCQRRRNIPPALYNPSRLRQSRRHRRHRYTVDSTAPPTTSVAATTPGSDNQISVNLSDRKIRPAAQDTEENATVQETPGSGKLLPSQSQGDFNDPIASTSADATARKTPGSDNQIPVNLSDREIRPAAQDKEENATVQETPGSGKLLPSQSQGGFNDPIASTSADATAQMTYGFGNIEQEDRSLDTQLDTAVTIPHSEDIPEDVKPVAVPYFSVHRTNARAISQIVNLPPKSDDSDEFVWLGNASIMPIPLLSINESLIKREMDIISGDNPFNETENGRVYKIGDRLIEISFEVINQLTFWNTQNQSEEENGKNDIPFALAIFLSITSPEEISQNMVSDDVMQFISNLLQLRTKNDNNRVAAAVQAIREYCRDNIRP